jgi:hypothetical protein
VAPAGLGAHRRRPPVEPDPPVLATLLERLDEAMAAVA